VFVPAVSDLPERPLVAFGFPGGGYSRHYYSMDLPDAPAGGQAAWHYPVRSLALGDAGGWISERSEPPGPGPTRVAVCGRKAHANEVSRPSGGEREERLAR
jgi:hypothetical protein